MSGSGFPHEIPAAIHHRLHLPVGHGTRFRPQAARPPGRRLLPRRDPARDRSRACLRPPPRASAAGVTAHLAAFRPDPAGRGRGPVGLVRRAVPAGERDPHPARPAATLDPGGPLPPRPQPHAGGRVPHAPGSRGPDAVVVAHLRLHPAVHRRGAARVQAHRRARAGTEAGRALPGVPVEDSHADPEAAALAAAALRPARIPRDHADDQGAGARARKDQAAARLPDRSLRHGNRGRPFHGARAPRGALRRDEE
ncbi:MAG: hypothetical protein A4E67_01383 [Syntrophaceae bacterium PtaB.Bin038]|nr:MAG: hypothetical protein A4E67_01383 [Syntrophaceae bacterium PtaB.Bin038]